MQLQQDDIRTREQLMEKERELSEDQQMRGAAIAQGQHAAASGGNPMMAAHLRKEFIEVFGEPNISDPEDPDDDLKRSVATETSRLEMFANIDEEEYRAKKILNQNIAESIKLSEYVPERGMGSKCSGAYRAIVTGNPSEADRPKLSAEMARRVDGAVGEESVRSQMQSGAVGAKFFEGLTQMQTAVFDGNAGSSGGGRSSSGGIIGGAKRLLFGG